MSTRVTSVRVRLLREREREGGGKREEGVRR